MARKRIAEAVRAGRVLEAGGADAVCIETMSDVDEAVQAIRRAAEER